MSETDSNEPNGLKIPVSDLKSLFSKTKKKVKAVNVDLNAPPPAPPPPVVDNVGAVSDDGWEKDFERLNEYLKSGGLEILKVDADGSCLFSSFAVHLAGSSSAQLRREAVQYMLSHSEEFEPFVDLEVYPLGFVDYCRRMLGPETWGGQLEIQALSQSRQVNVYVFQTGQKSTIKMINFDSNTAPLITVSYHDGEHYNAVVGSSAHTVDSLETVLSTVGNDDTQKKSYLDNTTPHVMKPKKKKSLFS